jgi:hydrogenase expression/formation protein HypC
MCLETLLQIVEVRPGGTARARADGRVVEVSLLTLDHPVAVGDWVVAHAGFALHRITAEAAATARTIREEASP